MYKSLPPKSGSAPYKSIPDFSIKKTSYLMVYITQVDFEYTSLITSQLCVSPVDQSFKRYPRVSDDVKIVKTSPAIYCTQYTYGVLHMKTHNVLVTKESH